MAFVRSVARQMAHGVERTDVNLALRKWWKLGYTRQNGLVRAAVVLVWCMCGGMAAGDGFVESRQEDRGELCVLSMHSCRSID